MSARDTERRVDRGAIAEEGGFLSRWSRRKGAAAAGTPLPEPEPEPATAQPALPPADPTIAAEPLPDPALLTISDDFTPFLRARVAPELKKAAMQKLFSDPGFNEIDGLDVYLDDFNLIPDLPASDLAMLRHAKDVLWPCRTTEDQEHEPGVQAVPPGDQPEVAEALPEPGAGLDSPSGPDYAGDTAEPVETQGGESPREA